MDPSISMSAATSHVGYLVIRFIIVVPSELICKRAQKIKTDQAGKSLQAGKGKKIEGAGYDRAYNYLFLSFESDTLGSAFGGARPAGNRTRASRVHGFFAARVVRPLRTVIG